MGEGENEDSGIGQAERDMCFGKLSHLPLTFVSVTGTSG